MGLVYSPSEVSSGNVPSANGMDHLKALNFYFDSLTDPEAPTFGNIRLLMLGSVVTGQASRRSDLDKFLVIGDPLGCNFSEDSELTGQQLLYIESVERATARKYHVHTEGKSFTEREIGHYGRSIGESGWLAHCIDMQDNFPEFCYRNPFDNFDRAFRRPDGSIGHRAVTGLRNYFIDLDNLGNNEVRSILLSNVLAYFKHKEQLFGEAGEFTHRRASDLHRFQRALEFVKAATRKALIVSLLDGYDASGADVTSKSSMLEQVAPIIDRIDHSGHMSAAINFITDLDREYDQVLDESLVSGDIKAYKKWLRANYLPACAAGLFLSRCFYKFADDLSWREPLVLDIADQDYSETFEDSAGESLGDVDDPGVVPSDPILVNYNQNEAYSLVVRHTSRRNRTHKKQSPALTA